jgi:hypothetical protein
MLIVSVLSAAAERTLLLLNRDTSMSAMVYLPRLRSGSATSSRTTRYATKKPIER